MRSGWMRTPMQGGGRPWGAVIQRVANIAVSRPDPSDPNRDAILRFAEEVKSQVGKAFATVVKNPFLKGFTGTVDGHIRHWVRKWEVYTDTGVDQLLAADFGYAIESVACHDLKAPPGFRCELQAVRNGTRPDIALWKGSTEVAWYDITASGSTNHIFDKVGWDTRRNVFEITYPSVDFSTLDQLAATLANASVFDGDMMNYVRAYQKYIRETTLNRTKEYLSEALDTNTLVRRRGDPIVRENANRQMITNRLETFFDRDLSEGEITSVLSLMGSNSYGFNGQISTSMAEHMLLGRMGVPSYPTQMPYVDRPLSTGFTGFQGPNFGSLAPVNSGPPPQSRSIFDRIKSRKKEAEKKRKSAKLSSAIQPLSQRMRQGGQFSLDMIYMVLNSGDYDIGRIKKVELIGRRRTMKDTPFKVKVVRDGQRSLMITVTPLVQPPRQQGLPGPSQNQNAWLPPLQSAPQSIPRTLSRSELITVDAIRITEEKEEITLANVGGMGQNGNRFFDA